MSYFLEVSTVIGCPNNCFGYCPQEVIAEKYGSKQKIMSQEMFDLVLSKTPSDVTIIFSGYAEPFTNPNCVEFLKSAYSQGHKLRLFTTLVGASDSDIGELKKMRYDAFCLHLPDGIAFKKSYENTYGSHVFDIIQSIPNLSLSLINEIYPQDNREVMARKKVMKPKSYVWCSRFHDLISPVVVPSGEVYLCCMNFNLKDKIGDYRTDDYSTLINRMRNGEGSFYDCCFCTKNISHKTQIAKTIAKFISPIKKGLT